MSKKQMMITQFKNNRIERPEIPINALKVEFPNEGLSLHLAKIIGEFNENTPMHHIARYATIKFDFACACYFKAEEGQKVVYLVGIKHFSKKVFRKYNKKFLIVPLNEKILMTLKVHEYHNSITELIYNEIQRQFKERGYLKPSNVRTSWGRHSKNFMVDITAPSLSKQEGAFWYHAYNALHYKVKILNNHSILIILDRLLPILKTTRDSRYSFREMFENDGRWVNTINMSEIISNFFLPIRKMNGKNRLKKDYELLDMINLLPIGLQNGVHFKTKSFLKLDEPSFLFGKNNKIQIGDNEELSQFIASSLKKYGLYSQISGPLRVQPIIMCQLSQPKNMEKIQDAMNALKNKFKELFRQDLIILEEIMLHESDDQVEEQCNLLRKRFPNEFDIVIGFLKGVSYNHPYRKAIKKGLQDVPSQIIKYNKLNSLKIFEDVYSQSILSQIIYKSKGIMVAPLDPLCLQNFSVRIYYDIGHFTLNDNISPMGKKPQTIVGTACLITENSVYRFQTASNINDIGFIEFTSRNIVRDIISNVINQYLKSIGRTQVIGNILIQRDGKANEEEYDEANDVIEFFKDNQLICNSCKWVFVEFIKKPVLRLFNYTSDFNPKRGTLFILDETYAYLSTTGYPDIHAKFNKHDYKVGVAVPLEIRRLQNSREFQMSIENISEDIYYRSFMWMASFNKSRNIAESNMVHELFDLRRQGVRDPPNYIC